MLGDECPDRGGEGLGVVQRDEIGGAVDDRRLGIGKE